MEVGMKISVLVCTRNRAQALEKTLPTILAQPEYDQYDYEVVVVDNASTDGTRQVIEGFARACHRLRYLYEARAGLSYARNTAVRNSRGELLAFTDDDVLVTENWLAEIHHEFASDPALQLLGGRVLLARPELCRVALLASTERRVVRYPEPVDVAMGANMAFRRRLFAEIGLFDVRLGAGRFFAGGEEAEIFYRALKAGHYLLYAPNVLVYHDHDRVTVEQACRLEYGYGKGFSAYLLKHALRGDKHAAQSFYWSALGLSKRWKQRPGDTVESLARRRAQARGVILGFLTAPWVMGWGDGETRFGHAESDEQQAEQTLA
jgi:glycosyltransferase involved in cell wall biosynthesis